MESERLVEGYVVDGGKREGREGNRGERHVFNAHLLTSPNEFLKINK